MSILSFMAQTSGYATLELEGRIAQPNYSNWLSSCGLTGGQNTNLDGYTLSWVF